MDIFDCQYLEMIPARIAHRYEAYPIGEDDGALIIATSDPSDHQKLDELRQLLRRDVIPVQFPALEIRDALNQHYGLGADVLDQLIL